KTFVRVRRWGAASREVLTLPVASLQNIQLMSGDTLYVDSLSRQFVNRVMIQGAVEYPGEYGLNYVQDLKTLVEFAKPGPQALLERAILVRRKEDFQQAYLPFSVQEIMQGKSNMKLQSEDSIYLYKRNEVREKFTVIINGEVNKPDTFAFAEGMRVQDLILMAGGLKDGASLQRIEISRRLRNANENGKDTSSYAVIKAIDLDRGIDYQNNELDFVLQPFDMVGIRKSPGYKVQITVTVEGQVMYPGTYTLAGNRERLSDIITRAGGLRNAAYPRGALLVRKTYPGVGAADAAVFSNKLNLSANKLNQSDDKEEKVKPETETLFPGDTAQLRNKLNEVAAQQKPVAIRLEEALRKPGSFEDIFLEEGDVLKVPKQLQTVQTFGAVNIRQQLAYRPGISVRALIRQSGGFGPRADRKRLYVVNADGTVKSTRKLLFTKAYPRLQPGSEIYVPEQRETRKLTAGELLGLSSGIISLGGLIVALLNVLR
ncbi:MAG: SLBB domain-containing protein, partial [Chitinophagaceae bacterium]